MNYLTVTFYFFAWWLFYKLFNPSESLSWLVPLCCTSFKKAALVEMFLFHIFPRKKFPQENYKQYRLLYTVYVYITTFLWLAEKHTGTNAAGGKGILIALCCSLLLLCCKWPLGLCKCETFQSGKLKLVFKESTETGPLLLHHEWLGA